jgi:4-amino-4-deoxy-L-arabinose transferase-like glycosyltransferase
MAMNLMTHTATLACALAGAAALMRCRKTGHARWALVEGAAAGFGSLIRPLDGLITAAVLGLWLVAGWRRVRVPAIAAFAVGTALLASPVFPYNYMLTGKPTLFPLNAYLDKHYGPGRNDLGFGPNRGLDFGGLDPFPGHGLRDVIVNTGVNVFSLNIELLGWATGSLLPVALLLCCGGAMRRKSGRNGNAGG